MTTNEINLLAHEIRMMTDIVSPEHRRLFATAVRDTINSAPKGLMSSSDFRNFLMKCGLETHQKKTIKYPISL